MKIVIIGNFEVPYTTENDWAWSYERLGHKVVKMQENRARTEQIFKESLNADIVHYVHTHGWETQGIMTISELFRKLKKRGIVTISVHLDYWRGLAREQDVGNHPFWETDIVFTADGGSHDWYKEKGINHVYLPAGVVERDCYIGQAQDKFKHDVIFVGSCGYHPEWPYRPKLINWLKETYGGRFAHYGGDGLGTIRGNDLNNLYASAKVVVGDTLCLNFNHPDYFSDRVFETTGRGGFLIFPYIKGIETMFVTNMPYTNTGDLDKGVELVCYEFNNFEDLKNKIDFFVEMDTTREAIKQRGFERTKANHTYTNRVQTIVDTVIEYKSKRK